MDSDNIQFDYGAAHYDDGGTGIDQETIVEQVFGGTRPAATELARKGGEYLDSAADDDSLDLTVSTIQVNEVDEDCIDVVLHTPDLTTGAQTSGRHARMVFRSEEYAHYRIGVAAA